MEDIALVVCLEEETGVEKKKKGIERVTFWLERFFSILKSLIIKEEIVIDIRKNQVYDSFNLYILILPFNINELRRMGKNKRSRIDSAISLITKERNIGGCLFPTEIYEALQPDSGIINLYTGDILYKALIKKTLKELYKKSGKALGDLEFCIISGENREELVGIVNQLACEVKYITVIVKDRGLISEEMDAIFSETGVPVIVSEDISGSARKADVVIFPETAKDVVCPRLNNRTVVVDLSRRSGTKRRIENTVVKGVSIKLPLKQYIGIDKRVYDYFDVMTIAEIILIMKISGGYIKNRSEYEAGYNDYPFLERLAGEFIRYGCSIDGIEGNNSTKKIADIKV